MSSVICFPTLFKRPNVLAKGATIHGHKHNFDHVTSAILGSFEVIVKGPNGEVGRRFISAPTKEELDGIGTRDGLYLMIRDVWCMNVPANWEHTITGLDAVNMFYCDYVPRNDEGDIVEYHPKDTIEYYTWITGSPA